MSERFVIEISSEKAKLLRRIAELVGISVESLISRILRPMPPDDTLDEQLERIHSYSDAQLWAIVENSVLSDEELAEREPILQRSKQGIHSQEDERRLEEFAVLYDKRGLLRAKALAELLERGFDVKTYLEVTPVKSRYAD